MSRAILVLSPHADDLELGCAGFLAREKARGAHIYAALILAKAERMNHHGLVPASVRRREFFASMKLLGATESFVFKDTEDPSYDLPTQPKQSLITWLDSLIDDLVPSTVLLPVPSFHQDHQYVFECGMGACRPTRSKSPIREVLAYEYPAAGWGPSSSFDTSRGAVYVDITDTIEIKQKMMACHVSQCYNRAGSLISVEAVEIAARLRGLESGTRYAELFYWLRGSL